MFSKISQTWQLLGASWDVLKRTPGLLLLSLMSGVCCLLVIASFAVPLITTEAWMMLDEESTSNEVYMYGLLFLFYFANYFVITFFNSAIIAGTISRITGGEPTVGECLRESFKRIHLIAGWALVSATVGVVLRIIESRSQKAGQLVAGLLGMAWTMLTFLVVPVLVVENKGPFAALKQSTILLKQTWGNQLVGNFSFGVIFFLLTLPGFLLGGLGLYFFVSQESWPLLITFVSIGILYIVLVSLVQTALQAIFQAALYLHAQGTTDPGFPRALLESAMSPSTA